MQIVEEQRHEALRQCGGRLGLLDGIGFRMIRKL